jgi:hypothetical protein
MSEAQPQRQPLWQLASSLGAACSTEYTRGSTTHVVAAAANTTKAVHVRPPSPPPLVLPA